MNDTAKTMVHGPCTHQEALKWIKENTRSTNEFHVEKIRKIKTRSTRE
ncbi:MAG: hypothetical protein ACFFCS_10245 [Candidatus Hodarchaeota archaeon]